MYELQLANGRQLRWPTDPHRALKNRTEKGVVLPVHADRD